MQSPDLLCGMFGVKYVNHMCAINNCGVSFWSAKTGLCYTFEAFNQVCFVSLIHTSVVWKWWWTWAVFMCNEGIHFSHAMGFACHEKLREKQSVSLHGSHLCYCLARCLFVARNEQGQFVLLYCRIDWIWLILQLGRHEVLKLLFAHCVCLLNSFYYFFWHHHFRIQSDQICTLPLKRIATTSNADMASLTLEKDFLWDARFCSWCRCDLVLNDKCLFSYSASKQTTPGAVHQSIVCFG